MGFGGLSNSESLSKVYDSRAAASDDAQIARSGALANRAPALNLHVGKKGRGFLNFYGGADEVSRTADLLSTRFSDSLAASHRTYGDLLGSAFDKLSTLSESKQTDGISGLSKTFLIVVLGALIAWAYVSRKPH